MRIRGLRAVVAALVIAESPNALADAQQCSAAAEDGQQLRASGRLIGARAKFLACAATTCPSVVKADCARWASEVLEAIPTVVIDARDASASEAGVVYLGRF